MPHACPCCPSGCDDTWATYNDHLDSHHCTALQPDSQALGIKHHRSRGIVACALDSSSASPRLLFYAFPTPNPSLNAPLVVNEYRPPPIPTSSALLLLLLFNLPTSAIESV